MRRRRPAPTTLTLALLAASSTALAAGGDGWPTLGHDGHRTGRSLGQGALSGAPTVAWKLPLGGSLADTQLAEHDVDGDGALDLVMVSAGRVAARRADDSVVWTGEDIGAVRVFDVVDLDDDGSFEVLAQGTSPLGLYLLDAATGATLWFQPTTTPALGALAVPTPTGQSRLFLAQQLGPLLAFDFSNGIDTAALDLAWTSATSPWSVDMAAADVDGDGVLDVARGHDRGFVVYDAAAGTARCTASNLIGNTIAPSYFPALVPGDLNADGRDELLVWDYSYYYSEDAGVFAVSCSGGGAILTPTTLWSQQWLVDLTPGPGNDQDDAEVRWLVNGARDLDGDGSVEVVYSVWSAPTSTWVTYVRNAATGAVLTQRSGEVLEGVGDIDLDGHPEVLLRQAAGLGAAFPKPYFSELRAYAYSAGALGDVGWVRPNARAATIGGQRVARVTPGAGVVMAQQDVDGAGSPAEEPYVFESLMGGNLTDPSPGKLLAIDGVTGAVVRQYGYPKNVTGSVYALRSGVSQPLAPAQALVMLDDGGLRVLDSAFAEVGSVHPGNHARFVTVGSLDGASNRLLAIGSSGDLTAIDTTKLSLGLPVTSWTYQNADQTESRGYVSAPGLVLPKAAGGARVIVRGHSAASYEESSLVALGPAGLVEWQVDLGAGWLVPGFENLEALDDLDGDGEPDFFLTELAPDGEQHLFVRSGATGAVMVSRPVADLFPPSGVYLQGHAAVDVNGDGVLDVVSALHGQWFVAFDVSQAATGVPATGFQQLFRTGNGPNGQAMAAELDGDAQIDLVRVASQNAFGTYERRSLAGAVEVAYQPPTLSIAGTDANTAAFLARPGAPGAFDLVWAGMSGAALGAVARVDGVTFGESWFVYLSGGAVFPKAAPPAKPAGLFEPMTFDTDGDGDDEVVVGSQDGWLYALNGADGTLAFAVDLGAPVVHTIAADLDEDAALELLCTLADGTAVALDAAGSYVATDVSPMGGMGGMGGMAGSGGMGGMAGSAGAGGATGGAGGSGGQATGGGGNATGGGGSGGAGATGGSGGSGGSGASGAGQDGGCGCTVAEPEPARGLWVLGLAGLVVARRKVRGAPRRRCT